MEKQYSLTRADLHLMLERAWLDGRQSTGSGRVTWRTTSATRVKAAKAAARIIDAALKDAP